MRCPSCGIEMVSRQDPFTQRCLLCGLGIEFFSTGGVGEEEIAKSICPKCGSILIGKHFFLIGNSNIIEEAAYYICKNVACLYEEPMPISEYRQKYAKEMVR